MNTSQKLVISIIIFIAIAGISVAVYAHFPNIVHWNNDNYGPHMMRNWSEDYNNSADDTLINNAYNMPSWCPMSGYFYYNTEEENTSNQNVDEE